MIDYFVSGSQADWKQRYEGTYGWLESDGKKTLVMITEIENDRLNYTTKSGVSGWIGVNSDVPFEFTQVPTGYFNTHRGLVFLCRKPERQYQRGISNNNTQITYSEKHNGMGFELIEDIYSQEKFKLPEVMPKNWAFTRFIAKVDQAVFIGPHKVADCVDGSITVVQPLFKQEILDLVNRFKLGAKLNVVY